MFICVSGTFSSIKHHIDDTQHMYQLSGLMETDYIILVVFL